MEDKFVIEHIKQLCEQRKWSFYKLAKESNIPYSSLHTMLNSPHIPSMNNLIKICKGFNITLSQFFTGMEEATTEQDEVLRLWNQLDDFSKQLALTYLYGLTNEPIRNLNNIKEN